MFLIKSYMFQKENVDVGGVAEYIFKKNNESVIYLEIASLKSTKELFYFLFDVFCKGLIMLFGNQNQVELNTLTTEQFSLAGEKLRYANIKLSIQSFSRETAEIMDFIDNKSTPKMILNESLKKIFEMQDNEPLEKYQLNIMMEDNLHQVSFSTIAF